MQLENSFTVPAAPDAAWDILLDVPRIAPCMPGAELTETGGEHSYKGNAKLRVTSSHRFEKSPNFFIRPIMRRVFWLQLT